MIMDEKFLYLTNSTTGDQYELCVLADNGWSLSAEFDVAEFSDWVSSQSGDEFSVSIPGSENGGFNMTCPECDASVELILVEDGSYDFDCDNCGLGGQLEMTEDFDDEQY